MTSALLSETTTFESDGANIRAFLARPEGKKAQWPAVLVFHEWWGLTEHMRSVARRLAEAGFIALVPDLYSRQGSKVTQDPAEAATLMNALSSQQVLRDLNQAVKHLKALPLVDPWRIAAVGFSMGGTFALTQATHNSDIKASVVFYGKVPLMDSLSYLLCPVLFHYGGKDGWSTPREAQTLQQGLEKFSKKGEVYGYPEADHAFFNDTRPEVYRASDAKLAWERTIVFLKKSLEL